MFFQLESKKTDGDTIRNAMWAMVIGGIVGLVLLYGKAIKTFVQVFVRVFLDEMGADTKRT